MVEENFTHRLHIKSNLRTRLSLRGISFRRRPLAFGVLDFTNIYAT